MQELQRDIGRHDAQIEALKDDMRVMKDDLMEIKEILSEARGGWKVAAILGGVSATIGALVAKTLSWMGNH
jgi:molybdopterin biosynthesis enzyme